MKPITIIIGEMCDTIQFISTSVIYQGQTNTSLYLIIILCPVNFMASEHKFGLFLSDLFAKTEMVLTMKRH